MFFYESKVNNNQEKRYFLSEVTAGYAPDDCYFVSIQDAKRKINSIKNEYLLDIDTYDRMYQFKDMLNIDDNSFKYSEHYRITDERTGKVVYECWLNTKYNKNKTVEASITKRPLYGNYRIR